MRFSDMSQSMRDEMQSCHHDAPTVHKNRAALGVALAAAAPGYESIMNNVVSEGLDMGMSDEEISDWLAKVRNSMHASVPGVLIGFDPN